MGIDLVKKQAKQNSRLKLKTLTQQIKQAVIRGTSMSPWEGEVLADILENSFIKDESLRSILPGQVQYSCVADSEPAGRPLKDCAMIQVTLTLFHGSEDTEDLECVDFKSRQQTMRWRRMMRICDESCEQGGLLTHEDLSVLLMCDVKTIGRDVKSLKDLGIILPTRGQQKDIGPGLSHRSLIVSKWLEGMEEGQICVAVKHSMKAVENYLQTFKRIVFLREHKAFTDHEIAVVTGSSQRLVKQHLETWEQLKGHGIAAHRLAEICVDGRHYYREQGEKKDSPLPKKSKEKWSAK